MSENPSSVTRRGFVMSAAGAVPAVLASQPGPIRLPGHVEPWSGPWEGPAIVRKVYLAQREDRPNWPTRAFTAADLQQEIKEIDANFAGVERRHPSRIHFVGGAADVFYANKPEGLKAWAQSLRDVDGILAVIVTSGVGPLLQSVFELDKPTLVYERPYSGHEWTHASIAWQLGKKVDIVNSSDFEELDPFADAFFAIHHMRYSKLIIPRPERQQGARGQQGARPEDAAYAMQFGNEAYTKKFGTTIAYPSYADLLKFYNANADEGSKLADEYIKSAARVVEPPREEIVKALRLHLAVVELMRAEKANAITWSCIGPPTTGELPAYPCISFSLLNDVGLYGVCENDIECAMTNILVTGFSGKPGFVTDPIFDTAHGELIHAHCSAPTAMQGVGQRGFPFALRGYPYSEEKHAAAIQVLFGGSGPATLAKFTGPNNLLVSTAEVLGNVDTDRGCRSKLRTRVSDAHKFLHNYAMANTSVDQRPARALLSTTGTQQEQLHRIVFYGDHVEMLERIGHLTGFKLIREI